MKQRILKNFMKALLAACVMGFSIVLYDAIVSVNGDWSQVSVCWFTMNKVLIFAVLFLTAFAYFWNTPSFLRYLFQYRYVIAGGIFIICVAAGINGSSIGMYCEYFGVEDTGILAGISRPIRSDEWATLTPMAWSQYYGESPFSYFSSIVRGTETDVFLEYGQAVAGWMILFRPFYIGYLFLPVANGMAFFWCGRFMALFLASFEFGRFITKDKKGLAFVYAVLIVFAPVVQWWFAINGLVEMLIDIQLAILVLRAFMLTTSFAKRIGLIAAAVLCAGSYILTFYPAWQVPFAYVLIALTVWTILEYKDQCVMQVRDWLAVAIGIGILALAMACILYKSWDTIETLMNTVYPGVRRSTGGGQLDSVFNYIFSIWQTIKGESPVSNLCECAYFIDLFPICYVLPVIAQMKQKSKDRLLTYMLTVGIGLGIYCIFGFPEILAKITLLSYSTENRAWVAVTFVHVVLLMRGIAWMREIKFPFSVRRFLIIVLLSCLAIWGGYKRNPDYYSKPEVVLMLVIVGALFVCSIYANKKSCLRVWTSIMVCVSLLAGGLVNPIRLGIKDIEQIPELQAIKNITEEDEEALWVVEGAGYPIINAGLLMGAPTINSTNVYPDMERWMAVDSGKNADIYNRYAHITVHIVDEGEARFELIQGDVFAAYLTLDDLKEMNVTYIFTNRDLDSEVELVESVNQYKIYKLASN